MEDILKQIFGEGRNLTVLNMGARSFLMFFIAIALVRISGMRSFGSRSAFDITVVIMLGAILSRSVTGVSPFFPTMTAAITLCVTHRILAMLACRFHFISLLLKGQDSILYKDGELMKKNMKKCDLSMGDLEEGIRVAGTVSSLSKIKEARMERSGQISVIKE